VVGTGESVLADYQQLLQVDDQILMDILELSPGSSQIAYRPGKTESKLLGFSSRMFPGQS
jgi:hypothetical protein